MISRLSSPASSGYGTCGSGISFTRSRRVASSHCTVQTLIGAQSTTALHQGCSGGRARSVPYYSRMTPIENPTYDSTAYETLKVSSRSEEHTSELQSHSFISYAVFCLKKKK